VSRLFAQETIKYKTMLRKLYTAVSGLEIAGIIRRTMVVSEIQLIMDPRKDTGPASYSIHSVLNTEAELFLKQRFASNLKQFEKICEDMASPDVRSSTLPGVGIPLQPVLELVRT
jgi:hypothetical protein